MEYLKRPDDDGADRSAAVGETVAEIVESVRERGDEAVLEYTAEFDGVERGTVRLTDAERERALAALDEGARAILEHNHERIRAFAERQRDSVEGFEAAFGEGVRLGQRWVPVDSVGAYVPGGRYPLLSSVLMTVTPAAVAGVDRIAVATPPADGGSPHPATVYGAELAGADELYVAGGAQAVAALAHGTDSVDPVAKLAGPGNAFTTEAKRQCFGRAGVDLLAGPSEVLVLADGTADPTVVAADLLAQAEHDDHARPLLVSTDRELAGATVAAVEEQLADLATADVAGAAWENEGTVVVCEDRAEAIDAVDGFAPEHLEIHTVDPRAALEGLSNYGSAFLGEDSAVVFSDKCAGTNHVLPTARAATHTAGLSVFEFLKPLTHQEVTAEGADRLRPWAVAQSRRERLEGHAKSAHLRGRDATLANYHGTEYTPREDGAED